VGVVIAVSSDVLVAAGYWLVLALITVGALNLAKWAVRTRHERRTK
jgi:hypothetical protein